MTNSPNFRQDQAASKSNIQRTGARLSGAQLAVDAKFEEIRAQYVSEGKWSKWAAARIWRGRIIADVLRDHGEKPLTGSEKIVLQFVAERYNESKKRAWPSLHEISWGTDVCERTVQRSLARLEWVGALTGQNHEGKRSDWRIVGVDFATRSGTGEVQARAMTPETVRKLRGSCDQTTDENVQGTSDMGVGGNPGHGCQGTPDMGVQTYKLGTSHPHKGSHKAPRHSAVPQGALSPPSGDGDDRDASLEERASPEPDKGTDGLPVHEEDVAASKAANENFEGDDDVNRWEWNAFLSEIPPSKDGEPVRTRPGRVRRNENVLAFRRREDVQPDAKAATVDDVGDNPDVGDDELAPIAERYGLDAHATIRKYRARTRSGQISARDFAIHCDVQANPPF